MGESSDGDGERMGESNISMAIFNSKPLVYQMDPDGTFDIQKKPVTFEGTTGRTKSPQALWAGKPMEVDSHAMSQPLKRETPSLP